MYIDYEWNKTRLKDSCRGQNTEWGNKGDERYSFVPGILTGSGFRGTFWKWQKAIASESYHFRSRRDTQPMVCGEARGSVGGHQVCPPENETARRMRVNVATENHQKYCEKVQRNHSPARPARDGVSEGSHNSTPSVDRRSATTPEPLGSQTEPHLVQHRHGVHLLNMPPTVQKRTRSVLAIHPRSPSTPHAL